MLHESWSLQSTIDLENGRWGSSQLVKELQRRTTNENSSIFTVRSHPGDLSESWSTDAIITCLCGNHPDLPSETFYTKTPHEGINDRGPFSNFNGYIEAGFGPGSRSMNPKPLQSLRRGLVFRPFACSRAWSRRRWRLPPRPKGKEPWGRLSGAFSASSFSSWSEPSPSRSASSP